MIAGGDLLEWAEVFGNSYGTGAAETRRALAAGDDVVLVIDVQGARQVRNTASSTSAIFVLPPSFEMLERPAAAAQQGFRGADPAAARGGARRRSPRYAEYEYVVINDDVDSAVARLRAIVEAERSRLRAHAAPGRRDHRELPRR